MLSLSAIQAQTQLKWNSLYWALGIVNMSVETRLADKWAFNVDAVYSPWRGINGNPMKFAQLIPEVRYYPKGVFNGFYAGAYAGGHLLIKFTKWNYINTGKYQKGEGFSFGGTVGYEYRINNSWMLDLYAGFGWQDTFYKGYEDNGTMYVGRNGSGEWIPYKIGAAFTYRLGKK